ncbi:MAG: periplasmic heavy metal sensor [Pseudomonadota bacterium]
MSTQRILILALFVSLVANAFFIGFAGTRVIDAGETVRRGGILHNVGARMTHNLDEPAREQVAQALESLDPGYQKVRAERRENYRKLQQLLSAPEPDRQAIDTVLIEMTDQSTDLVLSVHQQAVDAILELPADQRLKIANQDQ